MAIDETLLQQMSDDIEISLRAKRIPASERRRLQMDRLMLAFMRQQIETQRKVDVMWMWFRPMAWALSTAAVVVIGILITNALQ